MTCDSHFAPSRRAVLGGAGLLFASSFVPRFVHAAPGARDPRLLVIVLRGGMDGLAAVPPLGDPAYAGMRGALALAKDGTDAALPLDGFFALHPAMPNLARLYAARQATIVHATATGYRDRSHFDGQDVLESGQPLPGLTQSGWLNRLAGILPAGERIAAHRTLGIGAVAPLIARGPAPMLGWAPAIAPRAGDALAERVLALYRDIDQPLGQALTAGLDTIRMAERSGMGDAVPLGRGAADSAAMMKRLGEGVARLIATEDGPRLAALALDGWDTHANEGGARGRLANLLAGLDGMLATLEQGLGGVWRETVVMVMTEFGRTVRINGTVGTDHGVGTAAFLVGGAIRGGQILADWPGLDPARLYENRDLAATIDLRALAKGVVGDLFGLSGPVMAERLFPGTAALAPVRDLVV
jgi:uncharacterized protein (DUF1501 family)